jgi:hypothetical protein
MFCKQASLAEVLRDSAVVPKQRRLAKPRPGALSTRSSLCLDNMATAIMSENPFRKRNTLCKLQI